jgi:hypothetical protein
MSKFYHSTGDLKYKNLQKDLKSFLVHTKMSVIIPFHTFKKNQHLLVVFYETRGSGEPVSLT